MPGRRIPKPTDELVTRLLKAGKPPEEVKRIMASQNRHVSQSWIYGKRKTLGLAPLSKKPLLQITSEAKTLIGKFKKIPAQKRIARWQELQETMAEIQGVMMQE